MGDQDIERTYRIADSRFAVPSVHVWQDPYVGTGSCCIGGNDTAADGHPPQVVRSCVEKLGMASVNVLSTLQS